MKLVWEVERGTATTSSTSHMKRDNNRVLHEPDYVREERDRKY